MIVASYHKIVSLTFYMVTSFDDVVEKKNNFFPISVQNNSPTTLMFSFVSTHGLTKCKFKFKNPRKIFIEYVRNLVILNEEHTPKLWSFNETEMLTEDSGAKYFHFEFTIEINVQCGPKVAQPNEKKNEIAWKKYKMYYSSSSQNTKL